MSCFTGTSGILQQGDQEIKELNELGIRFSVVSEQDAFLPDLQGSPREEPSRTLKR
jgi:hypothetical protein